MSWTRRRPGAVTSEGGQAAVELALAAPLIMVALLGVVGFGRAAQNRATVVRAAAAAARVAVVRPDLAEKEALAVIRAAGSRQAAEEVEVELVRLDKARLPFSHPTQATVTWRYKPVSGFAWQPSIPLRASFVFDQYVAEPDDGLLH